MQIFNDSFADQKLTLSMDSQAVRLLGYRIVDMIVNELSEPAKRPVFPPAQDYDTMERAFGGPVPVEGCDPEELLQILQDRLLPASGNPNHPRLMGYVLTGTAPLAGLVEAITGTVKIRPTTWKNQPASCHIEKTVARWLGEIVGFSEQAAGYMTSGGSGANLVGVAVARMRCAGWNVRADGLVQHPPLIAYVSEEAHSCIERAVELLGLGRKQLRKIPVDGDYKIRLDLLEYAIRKDLTSGLRPFCLIGNAGTVNTGAIDPLPELADLSERYQLWFHVDGAYGAFGAMVSKMKSLFAGLEHADSLALDPHKWLNTPFEAGCILTKDWSDLQDTFSVIPPYLQGVMGDVHNQYEYGFELSRTDRALKVWLVLRQYGLEMYKNLIAQHIEIAHYMASWITRAADFELVVAPILSICCFRYVPTHIIKGQRILYQTYLDDLNLAIEMALAEDGRALVSGTKLQGIRVLRACIVSHQVTKASVEETLELLRVLGQKLDREMQKGSFRRHKAYHTLPDFTNPCEFAKDSQHEYVHTPSV